MNDSTNEIFQQKTIVFKHKKRDQSKELQLIFNQYKNLNLVLETNKKYVVSDILGSNFHHLNIKGNGSSFIVKKGTKVNSILTLIDPINVQLTDLTFSGNYPVAKTLDFLLKIHTPNDITKKVLINHVTFKDADAGGVMIHNIYPKEKKRNWKAGADKVEIKNCMFNNIGLFAGINIRGSHKNVLVDNCLGTDPYARQHPSMGKMFEVSAEVQIKDDEVGSVLFNNCTIRNANKGFFVQKVRKIEFNNIMVDSLGHNPVYYDNGKPIGVVALKVDDLGKNNQAIIDGFIQKNTAELDYRVFIALEESEGVGVTEKVVIKNFDVDANIRLGASGKHKILGGKIYDSSISFISSSNSVDNVSFFGTTDTYGIKILDSMNFISNCNFYNSQIINYKQAAFNTVHNCHLLNNKNLNSWIVFDLNNPEKPNSLIIENCSVPNGTLGVWSGGVPLQSRNLELTLHNSPTINISDNLKYNAKIMIK